LQRFSFLLFISFCLSVSSSFLSVFMFISYFLCIFSFCLSVSFLCSMYFFFLSLCFILFVSFAFVSTFLFLSFFFSPFLLPFSCAWTHPSRTKEVCLRNILSIQLTDWNCSFFKLRNGKNKSLFKDKKTKLSFRRSLITFRHNHQCTIFQLIFYNTSRQVKVDEIPTFQKR
jgi:hypothetical protein